MKRSKFSLSHYKLMTFNMGELIPITWFDVLPGDTIQQATSALVRVQPLLAPVMHPVRVRIHHWYVPLRIIWDDFESFITGGADGNDTTSWPYRSASGGVSEGSLMDYLGVPTGTYSVNYSSLPLRAYAKIFNENYRDQDLVTEIAQGTGNGLDATTQTALQKVAWEKDYFTTARPWEQKGTAVTIPLGDEAPIFGDNMDFDGVEDANNMAQVRDSTGGSANLRTLAADGTGVYGAGTASGTGELKADLSQATGISVNDLRLSLALQRYQEARAQYGSRYVEYLRYLGVRSSDARLQNPEYLGGGKQTIQFSEVLSTDSGGSDPVGDMKGHGIAAMRTNRYRRFFEEHGIVMSLMSVVPKAMYTEGLPRQWSREDKEDYFQRELQFIGDQEVYNKEVQVSHSSPSSVFGYQNRYDEYRYMQSQVSGEFRSSLDHWHMAREYTGDQSLNSSWVTATPTDRIYASANDQLYVMANHSIQARRMMSKFAKAKTF